MSLKDVIIHSWIEKHNKKRDMGDKTKEIIFKANVVESNTSKSGFKNEWPTYKSNNKTYKNNNPTFKKKSNCFSCGKPGHYVATCYKRHKKNEKYPPKAILVEEDIIATVVVSQVNIVAGNNEWAVDSGATKHICGNRSVFYYYETMAEWEELIFIGDSRPFPVLKKGKILLKLSNSGKIPSLSNALYVKDICHNHMVVSILGK